MGQYSFRIIGLAGLLWISAAVHGQGEGNDSSGYYNEVRTYVNPVLPGDHPDPSASKAPWRVYNIGNNKPEELMHVVTLLEQGFGRPAEKKLMPMQPGDVLETFADVSDLARDIGFRPQTRIEDGVAKFVAWYRDYHQV